MTISVSVAMLANLLQITFHMSATIVLDKFNTHPLWLSKGQIHTTN